MRASRARMCPALSLAVLSLVQSGWQVEETPLVTAPWEVVSVTPVDDETIGVVATLAPDAGAPLAYGVFLAKGGAAPALLHRSTLELHEMTGTGTGFTVSAARDAGPGEVFRVRLGAAPALVSLGRPETMVKGVSCDDAVTDCVFTFEEETAKRLKAGVLTPLFTLSEAERADFEPWGAAMRPGGGVVALGIPGATLILSLDSGKVTALRGALTLSRPSLSALMKELASKPALREKWDHAADTCNATPMGWRGSNPHVVLASAGEEFAGNECPLSPSEFEFEQATGKRKPLPPYPWNVLDCPVGGWTSKLGTMVTDCDDPEARMRRMKRPDVSRPEVPGRQPRQPREPEPAPRELPEAVALSATEIFVMEPLPKHPYTWYRVAPKPRDPELDDGTPPKGGLTFYVDGPSVLTFVPKGVVVEKVVDWRFGEAIFVHSLRDDWHLINPTENSWALIRLTSTP